MAMKSIRAKLLLIVIPILLVSNIGLIWFTYDRSAAYLEANFRKDAGSQQEVLKNKVNAWLQVHLERLQTMAATEEITGFDQAKQLQYLKQEQGHHPEYEMLFVAAKDGAAITSSDAHTNVAERAYFQAVMSGKPYAISDLLISKTSGNQIVVVAAPIVKNGATVGMVGCTIPVDTMGELVAKARLGESGTAFMTQADGLMIANRDKATIMKENISQTGAATLKEALARAVKGETGVTDNTFNGEKELIFYTTIPLTGWALFMSAPLSEATQQVTELSQISLLAAAIILVIATAGVFAFTTRLVRPLQKMSELTEQVAQGDLTIQLTHRSQDEIGRLANHFMVMIENMRNVIGKIGGATEQVKQSSESLAMMSKETKHAADQVALTIAELAAGTAETAESVTDATEKMNRAIATVQEIATFTDRVMEASEQSKESAENGRSHAVEAMAKMEELQKVTQQTSSIIEKLDGHSREIGSIVGMITAIARQTNLLALNASIEAARAGEQGKGFAVVAEEVRKLANETGHSAEQIADLIRQTQHESRLAVESATHGAKMMAEGAAVVKQAGTAFDDIAANVDNVEQHNQQIHAAIKELLQMSGRILNDMENISAVTQEASAGAEEVSASSQQQAAGANQIAADAQTFTELAENLQTLVKQFKTE
ncbi:methyl-accepting chemotaxis protein [Brevibacillus fluminis]|uniref:methyl-accepting chemotaxis protein n=1 Tax=Brevibacillus fluminis TaxID=511487 RepID=UPI003F8967AC